MSKLFSTIDAADYLGLSPGTLEVWRCHGRGPQYSKLGRRVMYDQVDLDLFVNLGKVHTTDSFEHEDCLSRKGGGSC
ncbi:helix-turn-helix domain-containing protein [Pseudodesulfovibrio sp. JC047]|uniref:helix-turn-helix domain-containing protein n=1 Tax=Pseudodesulfovibrio sp. JC047 TaxID=2683199 RepID=UPI0013D07AAE|nr:helix-turn-helix domain-containing protein [Pseudodesulfovibrio sp. JC047]NDV18756.1 helix-turn-helix domain-containing protein [Pseudodesulfovibrio sp. JC047]